MSNKRLLYAAIFCCLAAALLSCAKKSPYQAVDARDGTVKIALSSLGEAEPSFYTFNAEGKKINFFVLRKDGDVRSYFDACARCYKYRKGYRAEDGVLVCRACNTSYSLNELDGIGSCYPLKLKGFAVDGSYVIEREDLIKGSIYF